ncbi:LysR family transcriptional regulator [Yoonia sp. 208BN28-4]|uniref:LysR family transcriptional regulator n=1 Tax=Yoonia sp. 208BN28-4 TaxID=3126505 RepID=UPI0030A4AAB6
MMRNLDMTALRSFVAVAEEGGVTRAAGFLNLTQSAVSMQLKRLEESLNVSLLDRTARTIALTGAGEQLLSYARRMLALNDEVYGKLTANDFEGEIILGVPHDIVYPAIPPVLQRFAAAYPRVKVQLLSSFTTELKQQFKRGEADIILTTEDDLDAGGEELGARQMVWIGSPGGIAYKQRPLKLAFEQRCMFRQMAQARLDAAGVPWEMAVESASSRTIEATVSADLAVHVMLEGTVPAHCATLPANCGLPELGQTRINMYHTRQGHAPMVADMVDMIRAAYRGKPAAQAPVTVMA